MIAIYKITSPSGRIYIGQAWNIEKRKYQYSINSCKSQYLLYNSLLKHGFENHKFEIIHEIQEGYDNDFLDEWERLYIWKFKSNVNRYPENKGLNLNDGGNGMRGFRHTEESKDKMRDSHLGSKNSRYGSNGWNKGIKMSEETRQKISAASKRIGISRETRIKMDQSRCKKIAQYDLSGNLLKVWKGAVEIEKELGLGRSNICTCLKGRINTAYGFIWKYNLN